MIYIRIKCLSWLFLMALLSLAHARPSDSDLRSKLQRLLQDPEYDDDKNEITKPGQIQGMLLRDLREHDPFDSSSQERFYANLYKFEKTSEDNIFSEENLSTSTTTTTTVKTTSIAPTVGANPTTTGQRTPIIIGGIERLSSIISGLIDMWRNS